MANFKTQFDFLTIEKTIVEMLTLDGWDTRCEEGSWIASTDIAQGACLVEIPVSEMALAIAEALNRGR